METTLGPGRVWSRSRERRRLVLLAVLWMASRLAYVASVGPDGLRNIVFDEGEYLFESLLLSRGLVTVFYKGPFLYLVAASLFVASPTLLAARLASLVLDLLLVSCFYLAVRKDDKDIAFFGALLLATCPLSAYLAFHLLTDVPLALFLFLGVHAYGGDRPGLRGPLAASAYLTLAMLVKSTAVILFIILLACTLILRRPWRHYLVACAGPALLYLLLPWVWPHTADTGFLRGLPWLSFRCGVLYFLLVLLVCAGPAWTFAAVAPLFRRRGAAFPQGTAAGASALILYGFFTAYGDARARYAMTLVPFLALLAGAAAKHQMPRRALAALVLFTMLWTTPAARLLEADRGMTGAAEYLGRLPQKIIYTTIPPGVHQHAFAGALRFVASKRLRHLRLDEIGKVLEVSRGGIVIWTDWAGDPQVLERHLSARTIPYHRIDHFANRQVRPIYLVGMPDRPPPDRTRRELNILTRPFTTLLDDGIQAFKRALYRGAIALVS